jgi:hypothetical protein
LEKPNQIVTSKKEKLKLIKIKKENFGNKLEKYQEK